MALTDIQRVRLKIGDKETIRREVNTGDATAEHFKLKFQPVSQTNVPQIWVDDVLQAEGVDYTVDYDQGVISFTAAPLADQSIVIQYYSTIYTDAEIQDFLDQYTSVGMAAAQIMFAWAADIAKIAKRETLQGGGGVGAVTRDTSVASKELRATAQALLDYELEYGDSAGTQVPAEGLTEIPWTEQVAQDIDYQEWVREN